MKRSILILLILPLLFSCKKNEASKQVSVKVTMVNFSGKTAVNRSYAISTARLYLSNFELVDASGNATPVKDLILANSTNTAAQNSFNFSMPSGNYTKFRYHFGLDHNTNHNTDPATYADAEPLSIAQDMYWGMLRYRFIVVEGDIDSSAAKDQTPANPFSMHLGTDTLYRELNTAMSAAPKEIDIRIDLSSLFILDTDTFDITHFSNHSSDWEIPHAITITDNFVHSITTTFVY